MLPVDPPVKPPTLEVHGDPDKVDWGVAAEALLIVELAGLELDDWQKWCLVWAFATRGGKWAASDVGWVIGRQNGKTELLIAVILVNLFTRLAEPRLTIYTAHEYKTAREVFMRLANLLDPPRDADPSLVADLFLVDQIRTIRRANGEESIELDNGRRVRFLARTSGSGRGFTGDCVILDEAYKLTSEQMAALLPTMSARPNPQAFYASSGPFEDSEQQLALRDSAMSGSESLCYMEYSVSEDADLDDEGLWVRATPAHPHRISLVELRNLRERLGRDAFAREHLCVRVSSVSSPIPGPIWVDNKRDDAAPSVGLVLGVDINPDRTHRAVVAADSEMNVELVDYAPASGTLAEVIRLADVHSAQVAVDTVGPASGLIGDLKSAGVDVLEYSGRDMADAAARFHDLAHDKLLRVRPHPRLDEAVKGAVKRPLGDAWAWGRKQANVDISPLVAATLAVDAAVKPKVEDPGLVVHLVGDDDD